MNSTRALPMLDPGASEQTSPELLDPIENRKSGLSLNHIIGCPLDCAYCVRHLFNNFSMKQPHALMDDESAVRLLLEHRFFRRNRTPLQLFNRATDPFLPGVKEHTFRVLDLLARERLSNHVLLITRFTVTAEDANRLNRFAPLKLSLLVTYSGIDDRRIEPLGWNTAVSSLTVAFTAAVSYRVILYWRPLVVGLNDSEEHLARAASFSRFSHATVFTGLFYRDQIRNHYQARDLPEPSVETARRKILPRELERRILLAFAATKGGPLFRKTSCAVAFAHRVADFNGHFGIRDLCDICPQAQIGRCASAFIRPSTDDVAGLAAYVGAAGTDWSIGDRAITFNGLDEQRRYFIQHSLGYQVHDATHPHHIGRHGRADVGWEDSDHG